MIKNNRKSQHQQNKDAIKKHTFTNFEKKNGLIISIVIVFCLPVLLYLKTINFGFTNFDDDGIILNNISFLSNFGNALKAFLTDSFIGQSKMFYRPLQTFSYMVDIQLSGSNNTWMFHLSNILLLGSIACLLLLLLRRFLIPSKLALLSTLIYCSNPLFVSSIAWIPARGDLLLTFFSLLSFLLFIDYLQKGKFIYMFLNWVSFTIALFCKETAALLPILFTFYYLIYRSGKQFEKKYIFYILLYFFSGILWIWMGFKAIGGISDRSNTIGLISILSNLRTIPESLAKFFLLINIVPIPFFSFFNTLAGLVILIIIIILVIRNRERSKKEKIFCFVWFFILMLPPMLYKNPLIDYLDHRFFLPLIGILLLLLFLFPKKWFLNGDIKFSWILVSVFVFLCSFSYIKLSSYSDPMTFYNSAISKNPNSSFAFNNRALLKITRSDFQGALDDCDKAIEIFPRFDFSFYNRGVSKSYLGDNLGAIKDYDKAIEINPNVSMFYNDRGISKTSIGDNLGAIDDYNKAISINPKFAKYYYNKAVSKKNIGDNPGAIEDYNKAITIQPDYEDAYNNKGTIMFTTGNLHEAIINFNKAIEINPKFWQAYENRAVTKYNLKDLTGAIEDCEMVLKLNPNDEIILNLKDKYQQELKK